MTQKYKIIQQIRSTFTKGGSPGAGLRQNVPAMGLLRGGSDDLADFTAGAEVGEGVARARVGAGVDAGTDGGGNTGGGDEYTTAG